MFARWFTVVVGVWLIIAPFLLMYPSAQARTNDFWTGLAVIVFAIGASRVSHLRFVNAGLGGWLLLSPFVLAYQSYAATINDVVVGLLIIGLSLIPNMRRVPIDATRRRVPA